MNNKYEKLPSTLWLDTSLLWKYRSHRTPHSLWINPPPECFYKQRPKHSARVRREHTRTVSTSSRPAQQSQPSARAGNLQPLCKSLVWSGKARPWSEPCTLTGWWITFASWTWSLSLVQAAYSKNKTVPTNNPKLPSVTNKKQRNHRKSD